MKKIVRILFGILFLSVWCGISSPADLAPNEAMLTITGARMEAHVQFLADDLLEGRGTATRGYDLAALYVATEFQQLGLRPAGDKGTYFQSVPLGQTDLVKDQSSFVLIRNGVEEKLVMDENYLLYPMYTSEESLVEADVVFVGFGVTAPSRGYDDYAGIDVRGKIVAIYRGAPSDFPTSARAHYSSGYTKEENAAAHGAVGILNLRTPRDEANSPWERSVRQSALSGYRWLNADGTAHDAFLEIKAEATLNRLGEEKLFTGASPSLKQVEQMWKQDQLKSFALPVRLRIKTVSRQNKVQSPNVAGILEGSDAKLKNEYMIYSAHLDHIGITAPVNGDSINNGAYDNATGIAALIETARAFTFLKERPKRSILFLAVTAEEKGLQGADYFASNPTIPPSSMVANVNTDMFLMLFPFTDATTLGAENSSLGPIAEQSLKTVGLKMTPDPAPDEVRFVRSDQYAFIKKGIPSITLISGFASSDRWVKGEEMNREWLRNVYHGPEDESIQKMHWESGEKLVRAAFLVGLQVANDPARAAWNPKDFFGVTFGKNAK